MPRKTRRPPAAVKPLPRSARPWWEQLDLIEPEPPAKHPNVMGKGDRHTPAAIEKMRKGIARWRKRVLRERQQLAGGPPRGPLRKPKRFDPQHTGVPTGCQRIAMAMSLDPDHGWRMGELRGATGLVSGTVKGLLRRGRQTGLYEALNNSAFDFVRGSGQAESQFFYRLTEAGAAAAARGFAGISDARPRKRKTPA